jgi:hypothetical protein
LFWRIWANGTNGPSYWSGDTFYTGNPPAIPSQVSPGNNVLVTSYTPGLYWTQPSDPPGSVIKSYRLEVASDPAFTTIAAAVPIFISSSTNNSWTVNQVLIPYTKYYWHVQACNTGVINQCSAWSTVRSFKTPRVEIPTLLTPLDYFHSTDLLQEFSWKDVADATNYNIRISKDLTFSTSSLLGTYDVTTSSFSPPGNLPIGILYWEVRAISLNGTSAWSKPSTFVETGSLSCNSCH